jgi:hypothetical protein
MLIEQAITTHEDYKAEYEAARTEKLRGALGL